MSNPESPDADSRHARSRHGKLRHAGRWLVAWSQPLALQWLIVMCAITFAAAVLWQHGALALVFASDPSGISLAIAGIFVITSMHAGTRVMWLAAEHQRASRLAHTLSAGSGRTATPVVGVSAAGTLTVDGVESEPGMVAAHLALMVRLPDGQQSMHGALLEALERRIMGAHQLGWMLADLMVKLGLLGTVIGFIAMLGALTSLGTFDITAVQALLVDMSAGMRIALFTTLSGLSAGVLLGIQYHVVERGAEHLLASVAELSAEVITLAHART